MHNGHFIHVLMTNRLGKGKFEPTIRTKTGEKVITLGIEDSYANSDYIQKRIYSIVQAVGLFGTDLFWVVKNGNEKVILDCSQEFMMG